MIEFVRSREGEMTSVGRTDLHIVRETNNEDRRDLFLGRRLDRTIHQGRRCRSGWQRALCDWRGRDVGPERRLRLHRCLLVRRESPHLLTWPNRNRPPRSTELLLLHGRSSEGIDVAERDLRVRDTAGQGRSRIIVAVWIEGLARDVLAAGRVHVRE
jgi:hypothetical protein